MKNTIGTSLSLTLFGESHGSHIGAVLDGIAPGIPVDEAEIERLLSKRRPRSALDTPRREKDNFQIVSGVFNGKTTGSPLCILIPNENTKSGDYRYGNARPSHADYAAYAKYHGFEDYRGGGHFSGRITAALVAVGGILIPALGRLGITLGTHIAACGGALDRPFGDIRADIGALEKGTFPTLDPHAAEAISREILAARADCDSIGGRTESAVCGLPAGLGEPWFDSVESLLSHALFSIGGIKGVAFGEGFGFASLRGSEANDPFRIKDGCVVTETNKNGGVNGGITNGMPLLFSCAVKPTPSIAKTQRTVDFIEMQEVELSIEGRHDPAIIRRICPVIDSVTAFVLCDMLTARYGTDVLLKGIPKS